MTPRKILLAIALGITLSLIFPYPLSLLFCLLAGTAIGLWK